MLARLPDGCDPDFVMDIGCGTGRLLRRMYAAWPGATLVGVDSSQGMVMKAHQLTPAASIYLATAEQLPLEDDKVDLVTSTMSFHHWSDQVQGVREIYRALHHGGAFILADINIGHGHPFSPAEVRDLFQASNLSIHSQTNLVPFLTFTVGKKS